MLQNPSFEPPFNTDPQHSTVRVARGWQWFASDGKPPERDGPCALPEYKQMDASINPERVWHGAASQCWFIRWKIFDAGVYQVADAIAGANYQFYVMAQAWCDDGNDPAVSRGDMHVKVGIDPTGGTDAFAPSVVYSSWERVGAEWLAYYSPQVPAQGDKITVFVRAWNKWELSHNDLYVDGSQLVESGTPSPGGDVDYERIRAIVREEIDATRWRVWP